MPPSAPTLRASDLPFKSEEEEPLDVLDLPQLYQQPPAKLLLSTLADLSSAPPSWDATPRSGTPRSPLSGASTPFRRKRKIRSEGIPRYLTKIISSPLTWIESDEDKENIWEIASQRLSERSGRTAMGAISRTFVIPLKETSEVQGRDDGMEDAVESGVDDVIEVVLHEPALTADNLGLKTWASSFLLAKRLCVASRSLPALDSSSSILELGAGTGLVGLAAAAVFRRQVILTDLPEIVPNLERNVHANSHAIAAHNGSGKVAMLDWSEPSSFTISGADPHEAHSFPLIVAADPIYSADHPRLFIQAVDHHLSRSADARLIVELPLREAFAAERQDLRDRAASIGLEVLQEGEEIGYDDWTDHSGDEDELAEVRCWWSIWGWQTSMQSRGPVARSVG